MFFQSHKVPTEVTRGLVQECIANEVSNSVSFRSSRQQQGMNGALARMLGISGAPTASDEASLSDCSNSVEDPEELRVKSEVVEDSRRHSGTDPQRQPDGLHGFHEGVS